MCWQSNSIEQLISDGKFKIFKICQIKSDSIIRSYYFDKFKYDLNKQYKTDIVIKKKEDFSKRSLFLNNPSEYYGFNGFHSYLNTCKCYEFGGVLLVYDTPEIILDEYSKEHYNLIMVEGYIPEGSIYCINKHKEIISNSIVLTKIKVNYCKLST